MTIQCFRIQSETSVFIPWIFRLCHRASMFSIKSQHLTWSAVGVVSVSYLCIWVLNIASVLNFFLVTCVFSTSIDVISLTRMCPLYILWYTGETKITSPALLVRILKSFNIFWRSCCFFSYFLWWMTQCYVSVLSTVTNTDSLWLSNQWNKYLITGGIR